VTRVLPAVLLWILAALSVPAAAQEAAEDVPVYRDCATPEPLTDGRLSVVWISPLGRKAMPGARLTVVPARALRAWMVEHDADVPRLLAGLGLRKPLRRVRRPWKAVVFEVDAAQLCRPTEGDAPATLIAGAPVCPHAARGVAGQDDACGKAIDLVLSKPSLDVFHVRWRDASTRGFCVLPLDRFVRGN